MNKRLDEIAAMQAEIERLEDLLHAIYVTTLEADTKSRIANNMDATPNGYRLRKSENANLRAALERAKEAFINSFRGSTTDVEDLIAEIEKLERGER